MKLTVGVVSYIKALDPTAAYLSVRHTKQSEEMMDSRLEQIQHEEIMGNLSREWELYFFKAMRPRLFIDGDKWCCLYGTSIQEGVSGFGSTPYDAIISFNKAMHTQTKNDA